MGFFMQNKENQRKIERFVLIFYSIYSVNLFLDAVLDKRAAWIPAVMASALVVTWVLYLIKYKTFRVRAGVAAAMIQISTVLYLIGIEEKAVAVPTFMVLTILVAFYGITELLWLTLISAFFVVFYHGIITESFELAPAEALLYLLPLAANIFCLEFILHAWLKNRTENNAQIYKMIEALMEAEQSKDDFLSNVSHEIRTPVNTICGMSDMALREHDPEKIREEVFDIRDAGQNLMALVSDILDFSQLQQGRMDLEEEAYNITSTINDIINVAMARKGDKKIELIVDCSAEIPSGLLGDEKKIRRVIMNLVDNAIKFTNEGGVIIDVSSRRENYGVNLCVSVKDTGIGISEENLEKLFESFSQVDTRRSRQEGGVGLGLAIARALVREMGGTVTVRSHLGKGSVFRFVVPQKVWKEEPIGQLAHREDLNIAAYFDMEQFDMMTIRDEYTDLITNMVRQLRVRCHVCRNLAELKRRESIDPFTHIFISLEEYQEDEAYFDRLAQRAKVVLVLERFNEKYLSNQDIIRLYKPFYILPVVAILNGGTDSQGGLQMVRPGKFIAPQIHALVVDDNRMNIRVIEGLLKEYQIKVTYAVSGQEALKLIEHMCYDFVFMDHMMPEMDGVETFHRIRDKVGNYYQRVPIIALTANAAPGNREMFLEEGFNDFLAKPVEISVLERVLIRNLPEQKLILQEDRHKTAQNTAGETGPEGAVPSESAQDAAADMVPGEKKDAEGAEEPEHRRLVVGSLDTTQGMLYCGGREKYLNILQAYLEEGGAHIALLESLYEKQDWKNYAIKVHALKSTMHSIGAHTLSGMAKALEAAAEKGDAAYILEHHKEMTEEHRRVMEEIRESPFVCQPETERGHEGEAVPDTGEASRDAEAKARDTAVREEPGRKEAEPERPQAELPELGEEEFDSFLAQLEDAMFALDGAQMLAVLDKMNGYLYCGTRLNVKLAPVRKKIEMSDYMSAVDAVSQLRDRLKSEDGRTHSGRSGNAGDAGEGGAADR